ncbi:ABC transporter permease [Arachidicoccus ginsenosidivorans]|jgi:ABC-2 type transport system permease protein|uniref:ABC transporter permease n=1 Tax=Arachidicoccus ginsenosidivorans TaxID=496057 RepID=A0A5B8VNT1_9BACT|nr:ABC transporter permease [Arachidicoccus ginsenosidivorans]QEC72771.1 ABC transporter permease [Arachidicoccus ginsenosidivorans]
MNKIFLVLKREFLSRVQKKTFLLVTIGLPVLIFAIYAAIFYFSVHSTSKTKIMVVDNAGLFKDTISNNAKDVVFEFTKGVAKSDLEAKAKNKDIDGYVVVPADATLDDKINLITGSKIGIMTRESITSAIQSRLEKLKMDALPVSQDLLKKAKTENKVDFVNVNDKNDSGMRAGVSYGVGIFCGILIYMILLLYGTSVMRGVMEEKVSRIAEIVVSSIKPFQLMMGKILGIGAVGLLQFLIWIVLGVGLKLLLIPILFPEASHMVASGAMGAGGSGADMAAVMQAFNTINFPLIITMFFVYFLGGYFIYASLFAAIGCSVSDGQQDAQGLQLPITLPIIIGFVIMMQAVNNPTSGLAVFGSLFPLTSPIVMMARVTQGVPDAVTWWELALSIILLFGSFIFTTWFAGKIYRTGILMYGKKPTWKELIKWAFRKN